MFSIMLIPFVNFLFVIYIIYRGNLQKSNIHSIIPFIFIVISLYTLPKFNDASFILLNETIKTYKIDSNTKLHQSKKQLQAIRTNEMNIVLVLGESMRAKEYFDTSYSFFQENPYKTIYSGATNTDVSIPLLINGAKRPNEIDLSNNLFQLAKNNHFHTHFISAQNNQYLKYIKPYLDQNSIKSFKILATQDDISLIDEIKNIDFTKNNFIVLQMQGQHSPYTFYPNSSSTKKIPLHYHNSLTYSNKVLNNLLSIVKTNSKKPYVFLLTSDHGELIGENKKYGHNRFEEKIYKVPFVYSSNMEFNIQKVINHNDIYSLLKYHLGYSKEFIPNTYPIKVFGTMINEEDGFITLKR
jgi:glucan phosphoethanolaminetransferase (alkaline phosphatase superfamily)